MPYEQPARTTYRRTRIRWTRVLGLLVAIAAIAAALGDQLPAFSSPTASSPPVHARRKEHRGALGEAMAGKAVSVTATSPYGCTVKY